jgi:hypothetical protein
MLMKNDYDEINFFDFDELFVFVANECALVLDFVTIETGNQSRIAKDRESNPAYRDADRGDNDRRIYERKKFWRFGYWR